MTDIIWIVDKNLWIIYVTPSVQTVLGFSRKELSMTVEKQMTPESLSIATETLARELAIEERGDGDPDRNLLEFTSPEMHELQKAIMQKRREGFSDTLAFEWEIIRQDGVVCP